MDISSVKSQPVQTQQAAKRVEPVRQPEPKNESAKESQVKSEPPPKPSPVINTQGQTTGRLLNTTA